jgi:hypothetical protein
MVIREDVDIGSVVIGDLHKKSQCTQLRLGEVVDVLVELRRTQLNLIYCGLGLEKPTDDIADDMPITRTLFQRTPALTLSVVLLGSTKAVPTTRRLELPPILNVKSACDNSLFSKKNTNAKDIKDMDKSLNCNSMGGPKGSIPMTPTSANIAEVVEGHVQKSKKNKVSSTRMDVENTNDNVTSKITHKCDGR